VILPSKHLAQDRALRTVGARLLVQLERPQTVSALWEKIAVPADVSQGRQPVVRYDALVLTPDLLFVMGAIDLKDGLLRRTVP
jgi:hypothetical protein